MATAWAIALRVVDLLVFESRAIIARCEFRVQSPRRNQVSSRAKNDFKYVSLGHLVPNAAPNNVEDDEAGEPKS
jgi:hypothetical protein